MFLVIDSRDGDNPRLFRAASWKGLEANFSVDDLTNNMAISVYQCTFLQHEERMEWHLSTQKASREDAIKTFVQKRGKRRKPNE